MSSQEHDDKEAEVTEGWVRLFCERENCGGLLLEAKDLEEDEDCGICVLPIKGLSVTICQPCHHFFCTDCIKEWRIK